MELWYTTRPGAKRYRGYPGDGSVLVTMRVALERFPFSTRSMFQHCDGFTGSDRFGGALLFRLSDLQKAYAEGQPPRRRSLADDARSGYDVRSMAIKLDREVGFTYRRLGERYGISRERIRQLCARENNRENGGLRLSAVGFRWEWSA